MVRGVLPPLGPSVGVMELGGPISSFEGLGTVVRCAGVKAWSLMRTIRPCVDLLWPLAYRLLARS
jgi:hypothetical protein